MTKSKNYLALVILFLFFSTSLTAQQNNKSLALMLDSSLQKQKEYLSLAYLHIDSVNIIKSRKKINIYFSRSLSYQAVREKSVVKLQTLLKEALKDKFSNYEIRVYTIKREYKDLEPNFYRKNNKIDKSRRFFNKKKDVFITKQGDIKPDKGLYNNHIALWHSHGRYYEAKLDRWEWQRSRHFTTVEDIFPMSFVLPYLTPMLENAGATVYLPRERDIQHNEIIIDNDKSGDKSEFILSNNIKRLKKDIGFLKKDTLFDHENPFTLGSSITVIAPKDTKVASYIPYFTEGGEYAVYISYKQQKKNAVAQYSIYHSGGVTVFDVNQTMGGGTWIYLGTFKFDKGRDAKIEVVSKKGNISLDAVKIGGGVGNVARRNKTIAGNEPKAKKSIQKWKTSKNARYLEGARYWLQYAGIPEYVYSLNDGKNDYKDDYQARGAWVNYLNGTVKSQKKKKIKQGLNIPVDLSLALHTDAGTINNNSVIGTLAIYNSLYDGDVFPNKKSKLASRDLTDIVQTQIVSDIRKLYCKNWQRRSIWDREYNEAWRPNVPAMLIELLSHQNFNDMRFGLDPRFKFDASRAIYKGILKFQTFQESRDYVVQPLPVNSLAIKKLATNEYELSWKPVLDSLEETAKPTKYKVYKRIENKGFDNGTLVVNTKYKFKIKDFGKVFSFKITAINEGGESMPSEILSVGLNKITKGNVLIVSAFDRVCAPAMISKCDYAGIEWWNDEGVAHIKNIAFTGNQYDYNMKDKWRDDDNPGWGASYGNMEGKAIPGNTFDFVYTHGKAILNAGYSFVSVSDEVFCSSYDTKDYKIVDVILGEEKSTPSYLDSSKFDFAIYTKEFMEKISNLTKQNKSILISGAYIGTDLQNNKQAKKFAKEVLHFRHMTNHAVKTGNFYPTDDMNDDFKGSYEFNTKYLPELYKVEAPDAIEPAGNGAVTAFRYSENNTSAGVAYKGSYKIMALGFPFETVLDNANRTKLMSDILKFLVK